MDLRLDLIGSEMESEIGLTSEIGSWVAEIGSEIGSEMESEIGLTSEIGSWVGLTSWELGR